MTSLYEASRLIVFTVAATTLAAVLVLAGISRDSVPPAGGTGSATNGTSVSGSAGMATISDVPLDPLVSPEELPGECRGHSTIVERAPTTVEMDVSASSGVVIGRVLGVGSAQWNTPGGQLPTHPDVSATRVMRLVRIEVESAIAGAPLGTLTFWIPGGTIGCHRFLINTFPDDLTVGSRHAIFIGDSKVRTGLVGVLEANQMWPVEGDLVLSPVEGTLAISAFLERAASSSR